MKPVSKWRVQINGNSLQLWKEGVYAGSASLNDLYVYIQERTRNRTTTVNAQPVVIKEEAEKTSKRTTSENPNEE